MTSVMSRQDNWPAWLSKDLEQNWIESSLANQCCSWLQWKVDKGVFFPCFSIKKKKNEARKRQWQMAMNRWDLATKKWEPKHHDMLCSKHFEKNKLFTDHTLLSIHVHRVTDLDKFPVRISKDETPMPLPGLCLFPPCHSVFLKPC